MKKLTGILLILTVLLLGGMKVNAQCGSGTPSFTANLVSAPNATWVSPSVPRNDTCCGWTGSDQCIKFTIFLNPNSMGINFGIASGAVPPGALFYSINCGPPIAVGTPICLSGAGPHVLTFCKPGNNSNSYSISAIPSPVVPDSILVRDGCTQTLSVSGFSVPTITWNSINPAPAGAYNSYLSCTAGCATVTVTPTGTPPPFVDYVVGGFGQSPCQANYYQDTIRVYFYSNLLATINPTLATICAGSTTALLTATASGGLPGYTYSWSPVASTSNTVSVGPGTYTVKVFDNTGCPPTTATAVVNQFTLPIAANAGPNQLICKSSPTVVLSGTVSNATGGLWSGGSGTFAPSTSSLSTSYFPTSGELTSGVQLFLTTTGNSGCPPKQDTIQINFQNVPIANAGPNFTVCANNSVVNITGTVSGFSSTGQWTTTGTGVFTSTTNLNTTYTPSGGDITAGSASLILTSTSNGVCPPAKDTALIIITPSPTVIAGPSQTICSNTSAALNGTVTGPTTTGNWTTNGDGSFSLASTQLNAAYTPGPNDIASGSATLTLTSTGNGNCIPVTSTLVITIKKIAVVSAGPTQTICSNAGTVALNGNVSGGTSTGIWTSSGTGVFSPTVTNLGVSYSLTAADILSGSVVFTLSSTNNNPCPVVTSTTAVNIVPLATVNAGPNQVICSNTTTISLTGAVSGGSTGIWTSSSTGGFNPSNTSLNTLGNINFVDVTNGFVTYTLTSTNNGVCPAVSDSVKMVITKIATVTANPSQSVCSNAGSINLNGVVSGGTSTGIWSTSGTGLFNPSSTNLNPTYPFTATDIANGNVTFTLTSTNNGVCPAVNATTGLQISPLATVNAGPNQSLCSNTSTVQLAGIVSGVSTGSWSSSSTGAYSPSGANLNAVHNITAADVAAGFVTYTLTSTNNGVCPAMSDSVKITITKIATVTAGPSQSLCSTVNQMTLNGSVSGSSGTGIWTTSGTGAFVPGSASLNNSYFITSGDQIAGVVNFSLTSTGNGPCPAVTSTLSLNITPLATVNAGPNQFLCSNNSTINLNGLIGGSSGSGIWTTSGGGGFLQGNTSLVTSYTMTSSDASNGAVTFTLSSTNNGPCPIVRDSVMIKIRKPATVNAGPDQAICSTTPNFVLSGSVTVGGVGGSGVWSGNGSGSFNPGPNSLNTAYFVSPADISTGSVSLVLTSGNNQVCPAVTDTVKLVINTKPFINLLADTTICSYQNPVKITANVTDGSGQYIWTSSGTGTLTYAGSFNSVSYAMSAADITAGLIKLTISSANNGPCGEFNSSINIKVNPAPNADFAASTYTPDIPNDPVQFTNQSTGANTYNWFFGDGGSSAVTNPVHNYSTVGFYTVTLVAINQFNCRDTASKEIKVISDIQFPNVFTPNPNGGNGGSYSQGDYSNDVFFPYTAGVVEYDLMIFNRWGELIFRSNDINLGWDGYFNGKLCQQDVYVWKAFVKFFDGRSYRKTGDVTLLR